MITLMVGTPTYAAEGVVAAIKGDVIAYRNPKASEPPPDKAQFKQTLINGKFFDEIPLSKQSAVLAADIVATPPKGCAKVILRTGDVLVLGPETSVEVTAIKRESDDDKAPEVVAAFLWQGRLRAFIKKADGDPIRFHVRTPNVAAQSRSIDVFMLYDKVSALTKVAPFHGAMDVENVPPPGAKNAKVQKIEVGAGYETVVALKDEMALPPSSPILIQPLTIASAIHASSSTYDEKKPPEGSAGKISDNDMSDFQKLALATISENTQHLSLPGGQDPVSGSAKVYQTEIRKARKPGQPLNDRVFNWVKSNIQ
jgi:hypothetical protein